MKTKNIYKGKTGERLAIKYLKEQGYNIIAKNYKTTLGEIDIIVSNTDTLIFVEVKAREDNQFLLTPAEAITPFKRKKINQVAAQYLARHQLRHVPVRFDVIEVFLQEGKIEHIENAFDSYIKF